MISEMAISDVESLEEEGLRPSPRDVVRLNALGLMIERTRDCGEIYACPRVAFLGNVVFREPTIGQSDWISKVLSYVSNDLESGIAVRAAASAHRLEDLPDADDRKACQSFIDSFCMKELKPFTFAQVRASVMYAFYGADAAANEYPAPAKKPEEHEKFIVDPLLAVGCGIMIELNAIGLGVSARDVANMTLSQARMTEFLAMKRLGVGGKASEGRALADYFRTLQAIKDRLQKEKDNNG